MLIVSDERKPQSIRIENELVSLLHQFFDSKNIPRDQIPILVYHMNKPKERAYCEKKLGVMPQDVVFVGFATRQNLVVKQVLIRENRVTNAENGLVRVFQKIIEHEGVQPPEMQTPTPAPTYGYNDVRVTGAVMCHGVSNDQPVSPTEHFSPVDTFWYYVGLANLHAGDLLECRWYYQGRLIPMANGGYAIDHQTAPGPAGYIAFHFQPAGQWPVGHYGVVVLINGAERARANFDVSNF